MPKLIKDKFTDLPISRKHRYHLRLQRDKRCQICGESVVGSKWYCLKHLVEQREGARNRLGCKRRNKARSYKLQAKAKAAARRERSKKAT